MLGKHSASVGRILGAYPTPSKLNEGGKVTMQELQGNMHFCKKWKDVVNVIEAYYKVGVNKVTNYTGCNKKMIQTFARNVLDVF